MWNDGVVTEVGRHASGVALIIAVGVAQLSSASLNSSALAEV